jgi:hypothetical protein
MSLVKKNEEEDIVEDLFPTSKIPNPEFQRLYQVRKERSAHYVFLFFSPSLLPLPFLPFFLFEMGSHYLAVAGLELNK